jgi:hypothetical protein
MSNHAAPPHLGPETVAAYAEHRLNEVERADVERHFAECSICRQEMVQVVRILRSRSRFRSAGMVTLAAAAVLAVVVLRPPPPAEPVFTEVRVREAIADDSRVPVILPDTLVTIGDLPLRFVWRSVEPGARYHFALADESGTRIFSIGSPDTAVVLPDSVRLEEERTYQWLVDALRPDGRAVTSGVRFLRIAR